MRPSAGLLCMLLLSAAVDAVRADDLPNPTGGPAAQDPVLERGRAVYESVCIGCHGVNGTGTAEVPAPIFGDRPTSDLADLVTRTMPKGSPADCTGDDARAVAEWRSLLSRGRTRAGRKALPLWYSRHRSIRMTLPVIRGDSFAGTLVAGVFPHDASSLHGRAHVQGVVVELAV